MLSPAYIIHEYEVEFDYTIKENEMQEVYGKRNMNYRPFMIKSKKYLHF
jgi:hypothetical protein